MSAVRPLGLLARYVEGAAATPLRPSDIEVGTVAASGIAMASAVGVATAAGGFGGASPGQWGGGGGTVAASGIAMASTVGVATAAGGFREATLDHGRGGAKQFAEQLLPTHTSILGTLWAPVKQKSMFRHGIHR